MATAEEQLWRNTRTVRGSSEWGEANVRLWAAPGGGVSVWVEEEYGKEGRSGTWMAEALCWLTAEAAGELARELLALAGAPGQEDALRARVRELTEGCATLREQLRDLSGYCSEQEYLARRGEAVDAENADLRRRVAALEAEVAALRATATTPPWRAGPRG